jgi:hypothetical protein
MNLESIRELKLALLVTAERTLVEGAVTKSFKAFVSKGEAVAGAMSHIALGATPRPGTQAKDFRLAVRTQRRGPEIEAVVDQISKRARGEVDVRYVGRIVKQAPGPTQPEFYQRRLRPLRIGASVSDVHPSLLLAGTLGCFVKGRADGKTKILSNNHVLAGENGTSLGSDIVQAGTLDDGDPTRDVVATLAKFVRLRKVGKNLIDAAVADVNEGVKFKPGLIGSLGNLAGLGDHLELPASAAVFKVGRTTGQTEGRLTAFDVDNVQVEYDLGTLRFDNQIEFEGTGDRAFSDSGDSGSLIVDESLRAIALLFAGGDVGGSNGQGLSFGNPMTAVLDRLKVDLVLP